MAVGSRRVEGEGLWVQEGWRERGCGVQGCGVRRWWRRGAVGFKDGGGEGPWGSKVVRKFKGCEEVQRW